MPTAFPMYVMGKTLWDNTVLFEEMKKNYFKDTFGEDEMLCKEYLPNLSAASIFACKANGDNREMMELWSQLKEYVLKNEADFQEAFDTQMFISHMENKVKQ